MELSSCAWPVWPSHGQTCFILICKRSQRCNGATAQVAATVEFALGPSWHFGSGWGCERTWVFDGIGWDKMEGMPGCWTSTEEAGGEFGSFTAKIFGQLQVTKQGINWKRKTRKGNGTAWKSTKLWNFANAEEHKEPKAATTSTSDVAGKQWQRIWPPDSKSWQSRSNLWEHCAIWNVSCSHSSKRSRVNSILVFSVIFDSVFLDLNILNVHGYLLGRRWSSFRRHESRFKGFSVLQHPAPMAVLSQYVFLLVQSPCSYI